MRRRAHDCLPPVAALWLLTRVLPSHHREALIGDLIEQYRQGRTRAWCWRQLLAAIGVAGARALSRGASRVRRVGHRLRPRVTGAIALIALSAATLTWAGSVRMSAHHADAHPAGVNRPVAATSPAAAAATATATAARAQTTPGRRSGAAAGEPLTRDRASP